MREMMMAVVVVVGAVSFLKVESQKTKMMMTMRERYFGVEW
jgi:hypothetical protein